MRNVFLYLYTESILLAIPSRFQMCILLVYAFSREVYFLYTFSVPNYYYKKYTSVVYFLYTQCSILPIQMLYTKSIVDFDKGYYFPVLDATMDQRCLPFGYAFPGHEPDVTLACDQRNCADSINFDEERARLTCGHTFYKGCIRPNDQETPNDHSYAQTNELICPTCYPELRKRIKELAKSFNRYTVHVPKHFSRPLHGPLRNTLVYLLYSKVFKERFSMF